MNRFLYALRLGLLVAGMVLAHASAAEPPESDSPAVPLQTPQVTIEARRVALQQQLHEYVSTITRTQRRDEALHRWNQRVCPTVVGLTQEEGEFMLARLSQVARAAGTPLDGERCRANLAVIFTNDPDTLIKAWGAKRSAFAGVHGTPAAFAHFATRRGPVRVWYTKTFGSPDPGPTPTGSLQLGQRYRDVQTGTALIGSRMYVKDLLAFSSVAVIVDAREAVGIPIGPLTDYIAMLALADTDPEAPSGQAPTILRLFTARAAHEPLPAGLSDWDRAYLKALYRTTLDLITQRSVIADEMIEDVAP
jgi:hypothetical protein